MAIRSLKNGTFSRSLLVGNAFYNPYFGTVEYLIVGGGGSGGGGDDGKGGGGAGAGQVQTTSASLLNGTTYTVTVGAGGAGQTSISVQSTRGSSSVFNSITSVGGYGGWGE